MKRMMKLVVSGMLSAAVLAPSAFASVSMQGKTYTSEFEYYRDDDEAMRKIAEASEFGLPLWMKQGKIFMWVKVDGKPTWHELPMTFAEGEKVTMKYVVLDEKGLLIRLECNGKSYGDFTLNHTIGGPENANINDTMFLNAHENI